MTEDKPHEKVDFRSAAMEALEDFKQEAETRQEEKEVVQDGRKKGKSKWLILQWAILLASIVIIAFQAPLLISSITKENKPHRRGAFNTDAKTDACIQNLWKISSLLQQGKMPDETILCPASQKPYTITESEDDIVANAPEPGLYGFKTIRVSKKRPVPELIK